MARRGILDYVLGGAVGGLEGLAQQRAAEDEKKRMADALERQGRADRLQAVMSGMIPSASFDASNMVTGTPDMPGATPRPPAYEDTFGGQKFVMPELPGIKAHREKIESAQRVKASEIVKRTALTSAWTAAGATPEQAMAYAGAGIEPPANRLAAPEKQLKPWQKEGFDSEAEYRAFHARDPKPAKEGASTQPTQEELDEAEAAFNSPLGRAMGPVMAAFRARGDRRPPQVLMLAAYRSLKARGTIPEELGGVRKPAENWMSGLMSGGAGNPAAIGTPAASMPSAPPQAARVGPVPTAPTPRPAPAPKPIAPVDSELERNRQLWDAAVAQHGEDRVLALYGPRP
jgi:hypothetical protein